MKSTIARLRHHIDKEARALEKPPIRVRVRVRVRVEVRVRVRVRYQSRNLRLNPESEHTCRSLRTSADPFPLLAPFQLSLAYSQSLNTREMPI